MKTQNLSGCTLGAFVVRERITDGGFGTIYRGEQQLMGRDVVIKVLHQELRSDGIAMQRFMREAKLASQLDHPFAATIYGFGIKSDDGLPWIAMELVVGVTFKHWLRAHGPMSLKQLVPFIEDLAEVIQAAHDRAIIHRDLKPANVMVTESEGRIVPKLLDLGIAKVLDTVEGSTPEGSTPENGPDELEAEPDDEPPSGTRPDLGGGTPLQLERLTPSNAKMGSPAYMAPEQWSSAVTVGRAADIYALGVIIYEALTGHTPFTADTPDEYYRQHRYEPVPPLFSPRLDPILARALAKEPQTRHRTALELASELRAALQASQREQLRAAAQRWEDRGRPSGLLWGGDAVAELEHLAISGVLDEPDGSFVAASQRRARHGRRVWASLVALAATAVVAAGLYWVATKTSNAHRLVTQAEAEQGRLALLYGEPEARPHLAKAYQRDHSWRIAFMLARALQSLFAEQARFASSAGRLWFAAFSPDSKQIVTTDDKNARVWDAQTHRLLFTLAHGDTVYRAVYSADGTRLVTAGGDGLVRIWNAGDGSLVRTLTQPRRDGQPSRYVVVALSPDDKLVAAIDLMGEAAHVWDAGTGALMAELRNDPARFSSLAFSADGRWLATSGGNDVRVFDARTWTRVVTLDGPGIHSLAFDPTGPHLVTGADGGDAAIWAIPSGERLHHLRDVGEPVDAVAFSPDGQLVVTGSHDGAEQIWDAGSGALRSQLNPRSSAILSVEFDQTSKLVLAASSDGAIVVADAALGLSVTVLDGPANIMAAHFDPSSRLVVGASLDGTARVWDATPSYRRSSSPPISDDCGIIASREPDRRFMAVSCRDHATRVWDTLHDQLLAELPSITQDGNGPSVFPAVSAAGDRAAIARGNAVEIYELPGNRLLRAIPHRAAVNTLAFASTGHDLVSGTVDGSLLVTRDGRDPIALPTSPEGIDVAAFLADGRVVATAGKRLRVYDTDRNAILAELEAPSRVMALRMSRDGHRLVTIPTYTGTPAPPVLWDLERYRMVALLEGHVGLVFSARFVGDDLLTTGKDRTVRLWDGATGRLRQTYRGDASSLFLADATLSPDGSMVLAGGGDGLVWFWDVADEHPIWKLQAHRSHVVGLHFEGADLVTRGFAGDVSRWSLPDPAQVIEACNARQAELSSKHEESHPKEAPR